MWFRLLIVPIICISFSAKADDRNPVRSLRLSFLPLLEGHPIKIDGYADTQSGAKLHVTMLRYYISGITLCQNNQALWKETNAYHLMDLETLESLILNLDAPPGLQFNRIRFNLGVDSATSCSGAHGGDLDPAKGMYWAWQSGYVNFKLEGVSPKSTARKHGFHFHLGGYKEPYAALQQITLNVKPANEIVVTLDLDRFLEGMDLSKQNSIMTPGKEALLLSQKAAGIFEVRDR
jgi:hypothetical protein